MAYINLRNLRVEHSSPQMLSLTMKNPTSELLSSLLLGLPGRSWYTSQYSSTKSRKISDARWYTPPEAIPALWNKCGAFTTGTDSVCCPATSGNAQRTPRTYALLLKGSLIQYLTAHLGKPNASASWPTI
ncbi:hypothetical protein B0H14DRAFT_3139916 [Mycena olivaceomarginata]|nr:hypothetical protein B0H14DRAFT_3139916 [Mycena olivaceomarginata]